MIKHFNSYDVYRQNNYHIYPEKQMLALDRLNSLCRYHTQKYLIDCTTLKHHEKNNGGCVFTFHLQFQDLWADGCADIVKELIEMVDNQVVDDNKTLRDYIWFLKQKKGDKNIHAVIIFFGDGKVFALLDMIAEALQEVLSLQKFLTDFKINIPTLIPEHRTPFILRDADISNGTLLLDCGFASDFDFTENIDK